MTPHLAISYIDAVPRQDFDEFIDIVKADSLSLHVQERESGQVFAAVEWLIPTAVIAYVGKSYFDGFLSEMGKDHYALLKKGFRALYDKVVGPKAPDYKLVSTSGKTKPEQPYTLYFSIIADGPENRRFKLLVQRNIAQKQYDATIEKFLLFLNQFYSQSLDVESQRRLDVAPHSGRTYLVAYDPALEEIVFLDPYEGRKK